MNQDVGKIQQLRDILARSRRAVVFTGAGISTESGIPDFRSPGGLWTKTQPIYFQDFMASAEARRKSWKMKIAGGGAMESAEPNRGHRAVAKLVEQGKVFCVVTQNVDGLHHRSGVPEERIVELHGNTTYAKCLSCGKRFELDPIVVDFKKDERLPVCDVCEGIIKTATISFGQAMPEEEMGRAQKATLKCDLFIAIGSSLVVFPAAGFPSLAKQNGAELVILNREPTGLDSQADLVLNMEIGPTLGEAVGVE